MSTTKAFHAFKQKLSYFEDDIELIDVIRDCVIRGELTQAGSDHVLKHVDPLKHKHIARRKNSDGSRLNTINHLRATVYSSYIKDVYEEVTEYLRAILIQGAKNGLPPSRLVGDHPIKIEARRILEFGNWDALCDGVASWIFQSLESEKSTLQLLTKMVNKLALQVDETLVHQALPYLEVRHLLVHEDGQISETFKEKYAPTAGVISDTTGCVNVDYKLICLTRDSVLKLIAAFDAAVVQASVVSAGDMHRTGR